jgi:hypothetical protein
MKVTIKYCAVVLVTVLLAALTGCGSDSSAPVNSGPLVSAVKTGSLYGS